MFRLLNNCARTNKSSIYYEPLKRRQFTSSTTGTHVDVNSNSNQASANYCFDLVRQHDYENYLCALLMTEKPRRSTFGIRALNVEVSKIASVVSDDKIGTMRLKFWYDAIESIFSPKASKIPDHPVIKEIHLAITSHNLNKMYLMRLIKCRERPPNRLFVTTKELEQYAEESVSSMYYLLAKILKSESLDVDHALSHLGKAQGITNMLRAQSRVDRSKGVCIPQEIMLKHGVSQERILRNKIDDKGVQDCVFDVASAANSHLEKARKLSSKVPSNIKQLLLPAVAIDRYLERLRKCDFHLTHQQLARRDSLLPVMYYWNYLRKNY
ncbi:NADH dehydrogenase (ubiquinone) complex I, assembly factor 6 homolog [Bradysia coprophila]|uniref:NADH dehydrogenase (ubiquinone) complex I, assembly factor 6 homolog n=1 Tax=Bradysia coprophila TaxID=38358 RepID=UPI00187D90C6|nr:NADH dehydrogenase (ubiquinone) complex I, assembly factor 6 homolog [Bradysia coprophila]